MRRESGKVAITSTPLRKLLTGIKQSYGARAGGAEIKLPPGAGAVITDYGSGFGSLLFYVRLEEIVELPKNAKTDNTFKYYRTFFDLLNCKNKIFFMHMFV